MMKIKYCIVGLLSLFASSFCAYAQEDIVVNQYHFNYYLVNPAVAGAERCRHLMLTGRFQWEGVEDHPMTQTLSFRTRILKNVGIGAYAYNDKNGNSYRQGGEATFAYHIPLSENSHYMMKTQSIDRQLSFGLSVMLNHYNFQKRLHEEYGWQDPALGNGGTDKGVYLNANAGIYFIWDHVFAGFSAKDLVDYPVYKDDTFHLTIAYLVERIFHFVEDKGIGMVVIDCLQDIDGSILDTHSKERELNGVLRILKALAESMDLVIVVTSRLSERFFNSNERPSVRDIQDVSEAEKHCDQIVLIHPVGTSLKNYKMILPLGSPYLDEPKDELVLNVTFDRNKHCFSKATGPFEEEEDFQADSPMYQWTEGKAEGEWNFEFIDADGMGWTLNLEPLILEEEEHEYYQISVYNWAGKGVIFDDYVDMDDIELIKAIALEKARQQFPEVEIQEKS